jgi:hypothetical protein
MIRSKDERKNSKEDAKKTAAPSRPPPPPPRVDVGQWKSLIDIQKQKAFL